MRWKLIFVLPFAAGIAVWESVEYVHLLGARNSPLVDGRIVRREELRAPFGPPGAKLTIRLADRDVNVVALTNRDDMKQLPEHVRFRYTGDPDREVFIEGEEHPLWVALFLWIVSAGIIWFCVAPLFRRGSSSFVG